MIIYVDIDNTIFKTVGTDYSKSEPMLDRITAINNLYDQGNEIVYWTARGTGSGIDWSEVTEKQFKKFGVKYNSLKTTKTLIQNNILNEKSNSNRSNRSSRLIHG